MRYSTISQPPPRLSAALPRCVESTETSLADAFIDQRERVEDVAELFARQSVETRDECLELDVLGHFLDRRLGVADSMGQLTQPVSDRAALGNDRHGKPRHD